MSERIRVADMRLWATSEFGLPAASERRASEVKALVEAVEAAWAYWTHPSIQVGDPIGARLNEALMRFDFRESERRV